MPFSLICGAVCVYIFWIIDGIPRGDRPPPEGETMANEKRRGNRETRKPKAVKSAAAIPLSPFAPKAPPAATTPPRRK